jgi:hypothetical protein
LHSAGKKTASFFAFVSSKREMKTTCGEQMLKSKWVLPLECRHALYHHHFLYATAQHSHTISDARIALDHAKHHASGRRAVE